VDDPTFTKRSRKCLKKLSARELIEILHWDRIKVFMFKFMHETLKTAYGNSQQEAWNANIHVVLLHDNSFPNSAARTRKLQEHFNWELFDYPPYSPDHTASDYYPAYLLQQLVELITLQQYISS
jgi:hypothetical protein